MNRAYEPLSGDPDGRGEGVGPHGTMHGARGQAGVVEEVAHRVSVGEQVARGGWTSDEPYSDNGSLPPGHKYQGGSADGRDRAAYPGVPTPKSGTTY